MRYVYSPLAERQKQRMDVFWGVLGALLLAMSIALPLGLYLFEVLP